MQILERRDDIDGLRAISVLAVIFYHFGVGWIPGGFAGVDVFFVISGYLITKNIIEAKSQERFSIWSFYFGRVRRILPALIAMVATIVVVAPFVMLPPDLVDLGKSAAAALLMASNWYFYFNTGYFDQAAELTPLLHTWSLGVEWQFYLAWPFVLWAGYRFGRLPVLLLVLAAASFASNLLWVGQEQDLVFYSPLFRAWELALGALLIFLPTPLKSNFGILGLLAITAAFVFLNDTMPYPGIAALLPCVGAALVIARPVSALSWSPLRLVGEMSYSLYLWHWPVLVYFAYIKGHNPATADEVISVVAVVGLLSFVSWKWVETPLRKIRARNTLRAVVGSIILCGCLTLVPLWYVLSNGLQWRFSEQELALVYDVPHRGWIDENGSSCSSRPVADACVIGKKGVKPSWALIGDSHAETLMASVDQELAARRVSGFVFTLPGCPFIDGSRRQDTGKECGTFVEEVFARLVVEGISHVIIQDRANAYLVGTPFNNEEGGIEPGGSIAVEVGGNMNGNREETVAAALQETLARLLSSGIEVFYLMAPPEVGWNAPKKSLEALRSGQPPVTTSLDLYARRNSPLRNVLSKIGSSEFTVVESSRPFCDSTSKRCIVNDEHGMLYTDTDHLSSLGAQRLTTLLFENIDARIQ